MIAFGSAFAVQATDRFYSTKLPEPPYSRGTTSSIVESVAVQLTSTGRVSGVEVKEPGAAFSTFIPAENVLAIHVEALEATS